MKLRLFFEKYCGEYSWYESFFGLKIPEWTKHIKTHPGEMTYAHNSVTLLCDYLWSSHHLSVFPYIKRIFEPILLRNTDAFRELFFELGSSWHNTDGMKAIYYYGLALNFSQSIIRAEGLYAFPDRDGEWPGERLLALADLHEGPWINEGEGNTPSYLVAWNAARSLSLLGYSLDSIHLLESSLEMGYPDISDFLVESDLRKVRTDESQRFEELIKAYSE